MILILISDLPLQLMLGVTVMGVLSVMSPTRFSVHQCVRLGPRRVPSSAANPSFIIHSSLMNLDIKLRTLQYRCSEWVMEVGEVSAP